MSPWLLLLGVLVAGSAACDKDVCFHRFNREGCAEGEELCGACIQGFGEPTGNTACSCEADVDCSGHGFCRTDHTCACDPEWYGINCENVILRTNNFSDAGLFSTIAAWVIGAPVLCCLIVYCMLKMGEEHEDSPPAAAAPARGVELGRRVVPPPAGAAPANPGKARFSMASKLVAQQETQARALREGTGNEAALNALANDTQTPVLSGAGGARASSSAAANNAEDAEPHNSLLAALPANAAASSSSSSSDPPNAEDVIKQLREIVPQATHASAKAALQKSNWALASAIPMVIHGEEV